MESFGERLGAYIFQWRTENEVSQEEMAHGAFGPSAGKARISDLENGKVKSPRSKTIGDLCAYMNVPPEELAQLRRPRPQPMEPERVEDLRHYVDLLKRDLAETRAKLAEAEASKELTERAEILEDRLADPEAALQEAEKIVDDLKELLSRDGNELGGLLLTRARDALDQLDYREAEAVFEEIEAREEPHIARAARAAYARGVVAELDIRWADAAKHFGRAADLSATGDNLWKANHFYWRAGEYETALGYATRLVKLSRKEGDAGKANLAKALNEQAVQFYQMGLHARAEPLYLEALEIGKSTIGTAHPDYATRLNNLAGLYQDMGRNEDAEPLFLEAREVTKVALGTAHPAYATRLTNLAGLYQDMGRYQDAEPLMLEALEIDKATIGTAHPTHAIHLNNLAGLYRAMGRYEEAEPLFLEAIRIGKASLGTAHPEYAVWPHNLALLYEDTGRVADALPLIEEALAIFKASLGEAHPNTRKVQENRDGIAAKVSSE